MTQVERLAAKNTESVQRQGNAGERPPPRHRVTPVTPQTGEGGSGWEFARPTTVSADGATKWSQPAFDDALAEPICMASIARLDSKRIVFANPNNLERAAGKAIPGQSRDRKNLTVRISADDATSWRSSRVLEPDFAGYSDLAVGPDGTIFCLFERGSNDGKNSYLTKNLTLARFNAEWVTAKP